MRPATLRRTRSFAFALFVAALVASTAFTACTRLKVAPDVEDAGLDEPGEELEDAGSAGDSQTVRDARSAEDVLDADPDAERSRWAYCGTSGARCSCISWSSEIDSSSCAAADFPSGFCCADPGWPNDSNATCTCNAWTCHVAPSGTCLCGAYEGGTAGGTCDDAFCCAHASVGTCGCAATYKSACVFGDADIEQASCTQAQQPCPRGGTRVSSCSL